MNDSHIVKCGYLVYLLITQEFFHLHPLDSSSCPKERRHQELFLQV